MTSRERVVAAINHKEPDRVPIDLNGTIVTSLTRTAYAALRDYLRMPPDAAPRISHGPMDTVRAAEDLLERYGADTRPLALRPPSRTAERPMPDGTYYDEYGHRWRRASYYWDVVEHPLAGKGLEDLAATPWPDEADEGRYAGMEEEARSLAAGDRCVVFDIPGLGPFEGACFLRGHGDFCADLYGDPAFAEALLDKVTDSCIRFWDEILRRAGPYVDVVAQGDDVGMQNAPFMSTDMYRRFIKPRKKRLFDFIKSKTGAKIFYHSCGSVYDYIPDFIEEGVDILNPIQRSAAKMDIAALKREFGKELCFWGGGIDVQSQLPYLSPSEIRDEVRRTIDILAPGGGFVFFPSHNIQPDVSPDRIDALFSAAREYGVY